jgi:hypothetical protein
MEEIEMLKRLGSELDRHVDETAQGRVRELIVQQLRSPSRRRRGRVKLLLIAAALIAASVGGMAIAGGFGDGAGVDAPAAQKVPYVADRIDAIKAELAELDTTTPEGEARAEFLSHQLSLVQAVLDRLCQEAPDAPRC